MTLEEERLSMVQAVCAGNFRASMIILIHTMRYFADIREIGIIITVWSKDIHRRKPHRLPSHLMLRPSKDPV